MKPIQNSSNIQHNLREKSCDSQQQLPEDTQARATSLSFYRRFKRVNERMRDRSQQNDSLDMSQDKENQYQRLNKTAIQINSTDDTNDNDVNSKCFKFQNTQNSKTKQNLEFHRTNESLENIDTKSDLQTNYSYILQNKHAQTPNSVSNHVQNILFQTKSPQNSVSQIASNQYLNKILKNQEKQRLEQKQQQQLQLQDEQVDLNQTEYQILQDISNNSNNTIHTNQQYNRDTRQCTSNDLTRKQQHQVHQYPQSHQSSMHQSLQNNNQNNQIQLINDNTNNLNQQQIYSNTVSHRTAMPILSGGGTQGLQTNHNNSLNYFSSNQLDNQSAWSQQPQQKQANMVKIVENREKYNIFTDDQEMRRMALMSSSNKKRRGSSQKKSRYSKSKGQRINNKNLDFSPVSSQSGLFINGLGDQLTESQCREFEKKAKIQKTNYSSLKQQQQQQQQQKEQIQRKKRQTSSGSKRDYFIKIDNLTTTSPYSLTNKNRDLSDDEEEEQDLIKAASTHHNRSMSGTRGTPSKNAQIQQQNNQMQQKPGFGLGLGKDQLKINPQSFIFLGTDSTLTPSHGGLNMSQININSSKNYLKPNQVQDSLLEDSHLKLNYSKTNPTGTHQPSPISYQIQRGLQMLNHNTFTDDNSMTIDHHHNNHSPSISNHQNQNQTHLHNPMLDQSSFMLTQQQVNTIKKKMEQIAKELADSEELGLDENTLMRMFELKSEKLINISTINNQFTFEDNTTHQQTSQARSQNNQLDLQQTSQNRTMIIEDQSSIANSQYNSNTNNQIAYSRQQQNYRAVGTGLYQKSDTFLTNDGNVAGVSAAGISNMFAQYQRGGTISNSSLTPRSRKSNSAKFNDHFQYTDDERNFMNHRSNNPSKEFRETFALKDLQSLTQPHLLGQSEVMMGQNNLQHSSKINNQLNHSQFTANEMRLSQSHVRNNQTQSGYGYKGGDSTVVITNHYGNEESRYFGNHLQDESSSNHLIKSGSTSKKRPAQMRSLKSSKLQNQSRHTSQTHSRKISAEKPRSTISRSSSKKRYSSVKSKYMDHFKTQQTITQKDRYASLTIDNRNQNAKHNHSSVLVDPFVNDQLISINDQFINNNQTQIYVTPARPDFIDNNLCGGMNLQNSQISQEHQVTGAISQSMMHQHDMSRQQYNGSQDAQVQRQQSITPAFAESINLNIKPTSQQNLNGKNLQQTRSRSISQEKLAAKRMTKQKSKSVINQPSNKKAHTAQQSLKQSLTPHSNNQFRSGRESIYKTNSHLTQNSQTYFRDTLNTQQSRQTNHNQNSQQRSNSKRQRSRSIGKEQSRTNSQISRFKNSTYKQFTLNNTKNSTSQYANHNLKSGSTASYQTGFCGMSTNTHQQNIESAPRCKCLQKLQQSKDIIKQALKVKYDARLKEMKTQFEQKFRKNELTWKNRLDCHKQALHKEQLKNGGLQGVIEEMTARIGEVERKNKDMLRMIRQAQKEANNNNNSNGGNIENNRGGSHDDNGDGRDLIETQQNDNNNSDVQVQRKRKGSKLAQRAYQQKIQSQTNSNVNSQGFILSGGEPSQAFKNRCKSSSSSSQSSSEDDERHEEYNQKQIIGDEHKLKRIEKILYKK